MGGYPTPSRNYRVSIRPLKYGALISNIVSFISQGHSWSALNISAQMFKFLARIFVLLPGFYAYLQTFGPKVTGQDDPLFATYDRSISECKSLSGHDHEVSGESG